MQITHLHAFLAVAEELNFRRAAARVFLSQPALSAQIRQLEHDLGVRLFERDKRGTRLSADGRALVPVARDALAAIAEIELAAGRSRPPRSRLVVGLLAMGVGDLTWPLLRTFHEVRPDVALTVVQLGFVDALSSLESGACDVLLSVGPFGECGVHSETVGTMPVDVVLPLEYAMAEAPSVPLGWLAEHVTIRPPMSMGRAWCDFWSMREYGGHPEFEFAQRPLNSIPQLVDAIAGAGVCGPWPRAAGLADAVAIRPLDTSFDAPVQIVTRARSTPEERLLTQLGRRLTELSSDSPSLR